MQDIDGLITPDPNTKVALVTVELTVITNSSEIIVVGVGEVGRGTAIPDIVQSLILGSVAQSVAAVIVVLVSR